MAWKAGLGGVLEVVATAKTSSGRRGNGASVGTTTVRGDEKEGGVLESGKMEVSTA